MGSHSVRTHWMCQCCVLYLAWWWFSKPKHVAVFFNFNTDYQYMLCYWLNKLLYYCKTQGNGSYQREIFAMKTWKLAACTKFILHPRCLHDSVTVWYFFNFCVKNKYSEFFSSGRMFTPVCIDALLSIYSSQESHFSPMCYCHFPEI